MGSGTTALIVSNKEIEDIMKIQKYKRWYFEIQNYYQSEPEFNGVYSRNNLQKKKDGTYIINLDEYESIGTHWIALYVNAENITYFDSFEVEHVPKEMRNFIRNENITIIYRMQAYNSVMCGYFIINVWTIYLFYGRR